MTGYETLLKAFNDDRLLLDLHLSNLQVEKELYPGYIQILLESTKATQDIRLQWPADDLKAFNLDTIKCLPYESLPALLKARRIAYKKNEPGKIKEYKDLS
jgi:hypothetical protein